MSNWHGRPFDETTNAYKQGIDIPVISSCALLSVAWIRLNVVI